MFTTEGFWVTVAFITLIGLAFKPVKSAILTLLDKYISEIKATLKEAQDLKLEADKNLASAKQKLDDSKQLGEQILLRSKQEASSIIENAKKASEHDAKKQIELIISNFETRKKQMVADIKEQAISKAVEQVSIKLVEELEQDELESTLIDSSIKRFKHIKH